MNIFKMVLLALLLQGSAQQPSSVSFRGVVTKLHSDEPVVRATVELQPEGGDSQPYTIMTKDDGSFVFPRVLPGPYQLAVSRPGYVSAIYGQRRFDGPGEVIAISETSPAVRIELTPTAAISGRIVDAEGKPLGNVLVSASKVSYVQGRRVLRGVQSTLTNDLGEYRLFWLPPGQYFVGAQSDTVGVQGIGFGGTNELQEVRFHLQSVTSQPPPMKVFFAAIIYYPNTTDDLAASPFDLASGADVRDVNIVVTPIPLRHIRGVVVSETGQPAGPYQLQLAGAQSSLVRSLQTSTFDIGDVRPGIYSLIATIGQLSGRTAIEVRDRDIDNVIVRVAPGFDISGKIVIQGDSAAAKLDLSKLSVNLRLDPNSGPGAGPSTPSADGSFTLHNVTTTNYRVAIQPALQNAFIKSVRLAGADVLNSGIHLEVPPKGDLEIVINTNPGALDGTVVDAKQQPVSKVSVALVPEIDLRSRPEFYKTASTDATGHFQFKNITPGDYKVFAWEFVEDGAWQNAEFLGPYENFGKTVRIDEGGMGSVEVMIIPAVDQR